MFDVRQFKRSIYLLLLLGITGFALAAESPGVFALGIGGVLFNAWLVRTERFTPLPRLVVNVITILSLLYVVQQVFNSDGTPVLVIGEFLVLLQLIKIYEQRGNRDYAQMLVLGLLLMVAAAISTLSLLFAILLLVYVFLSLYCCLLFHLKLDADAAALAAAGAPARPSDSTLQQDQRYLSRSMRRLTIVVSVCSIVFATIVFLLFPRGSGGGMLGPMQLRRSQTLTGFSDQVSFQQVAKIQQNDDIVAHVQVFKDDVLVSGTQPLLLRGVTLDHYSGAASRFEAPWQWSRSQTDVAFPLLPGHNRPISLTETDTDKLKGLIRQKIMLQPTGSSVLFSIAGPLTISSSRSMKLRFFSYDGVIQASDAPNDTLAYEVVARNSLDPPPDAELPPVLHEDIDPEILAYAMRPEVCGVNNAGIPLARLRNPRLPVDPLDEQIATNITKHLRTTFNYTLDLTDTKRIEGRDPLTAFLYDFKKGHCEYFAGAMTRLCQSLGMQARMVVGFRCDEYNEFANQYIVRQSHAHAWVEIHTAAGWKTFDPTSSSQVGREGRLSAFWSRIKHATDYLEYTYANHVITYNNENRSTVIQAVRTRIADWTSRLSAFVAGLRRWLQSVAFWTISTTLLAVIVGIMFVVLILALLLFFWEKWILRRRAERIGIDSLPPAEQLRLARQLAFYDDLLLLLGRHRIARPNYLTPREFADSLLYLPSDTYETVKRLTGLFYRVRFGGRELSGGQQKRLDVVITRLGDQLLRDLPETA